MDQMLKKLMLRPKVWPQQQCQSGVWMLLRIGETCFAIEIPEYGGGRGHLAAASAVLALAAL